MICDTLDQNARSRLDRLTQDIDEDLDDFIKKKDEFYLQEFERSQIGGPIPNVDNAYLYTEADVERIERINESLRKVAPMLPPSEDLSSEPSIIKGKQDYDHSKFIGSNFDDKQSLRSLPMSTVTRKSQVTMLTHATALSKSVLPKDRKLREIAEQRLLKN